MEPIKFDAADGFPLSGSLFTGTGVGPVALIASATAVPQGYYAKFASYLVDERGFEAAMTFDYRGMTKSATPKGWPARINYRDWGLFDLPAAVDFLDKAFPGREMVGVGHSFGGQGFGISGRSDRFSRFAMVASQLGYWRLSDDRRNVFYTMNFIGVPLTLLLGKAPGWSGIGEDMPGSAYRDWARWCRSPNYMFDDPAVQAQEKYRTVKTPILLIGLEDDPWATRRATAALLARYENAPHGQRWISPQEVGGKIGHLGFFRSKFRGNLWPELADWLKTGFPDNGDAAEPPPTSSVSVDGRRQPRQT